MPQFSLVLSGIGHQVRDISKHSVLLSAESAEDAKRWLAPRGKSQHIRRGRGHSAEAALVPLHFSLIHAGHLLECSLSIPSLGGNVAEFIKSAEHTRHDPPRPGSSSRHSHLAGTSGPHQAPHSRVFGLRKQNQPPLTYSLCRLTRIFSVRATGLHTRPHNLGCCRPDKVTAPPRSYLLFATARAASSTANGAGTLA